MSDFPFDITLDRINEDGSESVDGKWWPDEIAARLVDPADPQVRSRAVHAVRNLGFVIEHRTIANAVLDALAATDAGGVGRDA